MPKQRMHLTAAEAAEKGWLCRSHLKARRLAPGPNTKPAGSVWQGWAAYDVYDPADCVPWRWQPGPAQLRRKAIAEQAKALIIGDCLTLDTETTGLGDDAEICEIAILDSAGTPLMNTLIRPSRPIPPEATAIHGITDAMVATSPTWPEVASQYASIVSARTVVAYNMAFDNRLLRQTHEIYSLPCPALSTACAMKMFATWHGEWDHYREHWRWLKLIEAAELCGGDLAGAHRALADARMTLAVLHFLQLRTNGKRK